jgi:hypothetical protein
MSHQKKGPQKMKQSKAERKEFEEVIAELNHESKALTDTSSQRIE